MILSVEQLAKKSRVTIWSLAVLGVITGAALIGLAYNEHIDTLDNAIVREQDIKITELRDRILHLDTVLSMSAGMATATGDRRWEKRYRVFEPKLNDAIRELKRIAPGIYRKQAVLEKDLANEKLVEMEHRVLALVDRNRLIEAQAILFSKEYDTQRRIFSDGLETLAIQFQNMANENLKFAYTRANRNLAAAFFIFLLLTGTWVIVLRTINRSHRTLVETSSQLARQTEELNGLNAGLDREVTERAKDLDESRIAALNMMEDAVEARAKTEQAYKKLLQEVDVRKEAEATIQRMAFYDTLTDLPNRNFLNGRLLNAIQTDSGEGKPMALLLLDLDHFKEVNDTLGHHRGDLLLKEMGVRLKSILYEPDIVARLGGDEFGILLPKLANTEDIKVVIQKIQDTLQHPFMIEGLPIAVEASIGVTLYPNHGENPDGLMQRADVAMYRAKETGSGYVIYDNQHDQHSPRRLALIGELRQAIEKDQLSLYYQPKISFKTNHVIGVEALVRWQHPEYGFVPPEQFILPAEQTGLIHPLTRWVLKTALCQSDAWRQAGLNCPVAVNLSARNLHDPQLRDHLAKILKTSSVSPQQLELEITESAIMADPQRALEVITSLRAMGLRFALDDFGIGYSSLAYLKKLPVDTIKIDKSFVMDMEKDQDDVLIVLSTINLAHNLGLKVVAEGVETEQTWAQLFTFGCDAAQGYYMSKPMPAADLTRWLKESPWGMNKVRQGL